MMKKTSYIKTLTLNDILAIKSIARCGYVTTEQLQIYLTKNRIKNLYKERIFKKEIFNYNALFIIAYALTKKGKKIAMKNGINKVYREQSIPHDIKLANKYFSLNDIEKNTWQTESDIQQRFPENLNKDNYSIPDCCYTTEDGIEIYFESVTYSYRKEDLKKKENAFEILKKANSKYYTE